MKKSRITIDSNSDLPTKEDYLPKEVLDPCHLNNSELSILEHLINVSLTAHVKPLVLPGKELTRVQQIHSFIEDMVEKENKRRSTARNEYWFRKEHQITIRREVGRKELLLLAS